ncbi:LOG family protein [bacterium]|nr:LOG family protein [bacterium]
MQIQKVQSYTSFQANIPNVISPEYKTPQSKSNTVAVLGSSKATDDILKYMDICSNSVKAMILGGKNIVTGCGSMGIMGSAFNSAKNYSKNNEEGKPIQNLAIVKEPLWGDEDLENCITIASANSEAERIDKFSEVADTMVIFAGSTTTLQEATTLITKNYYGKEEDKKKIVLVGKDFFNGLAEQYNKLYETGLIKCEPSELFTVVDSEEELKQVIGY